LSLTSGPYGFRPVGLIGGRVFAGATRKLQIASGYATNIFFGDPVKYVAGGTIAKDTGTTTMTPVGIFMGVSYTDPVYGFTNRQQWTASTVASDAYALICDDPYALFEIQADGAVSTLFKNAGINQTAGSTITGDSKISLNSAGIATTSTLPLRIVDYVRSGVSSSGDAFTDLLVMWNFGTHAYQQATGT
jgi:hypothetical protein